MGKDPGLAAVAGLVIPGAGQMYTGRWLFGLAILVAVVILNVVFQLINPLLLVIPFAIYLWALYEATNYASG